MVLKIISPDSGLRASLLSFTLWYPIFDAPWDTGYPTFHNPNANTARPGIPKSLAILFISDEAFWNILSFRTSL